MARDFAHLSRRELLAACLATPGVAIAAANDPGAAPATAAPFQIIKPAPLPPFQFHDANGGQVSLKQFRGRFVLLNIWATWYVPSYDEMASLDRLQARLGGPRFEVVPVSVDTGGLIPVKTFYAQDGLRHLKIYLDPSGSAMRLFDISDLPAAFLIDSQGKRIGATTSVTDWNTPAMIAFLRKVMSAGQYAKAGETGK